MATNVIVSKKLITFCLCIFSLIYADAQNVTINGIRYYLYPETHETAINNRSTWVGELEIPSEIEHNGEKYFVVGMKSNAFDDCTELTKVKIPKTINSIIHRVLTDDPNVSGQTSPDAMNPFYRCTTLESVEVDEDNPIMSSEGGILYSKDKTQLYCYPAGMQQEEYAIPENITWIGCGAIADNHYISSLIMPNSVTYCGSICENCVNIKSIKLSENITYIPAYSFDKCESLKVLDIPESVQDFGESVFRWTHLEKLVIRGTFPNGLRKDTFYFMDDATILYVQQSEIEKFKKVFSGTVLPLEEYVSNINHITSNQATKTIYDLQGRRLSEKPAKGIYIQNGKKIVK